MFCVTAVTVVVTFVGFLLSRSAVTYLTCLLTYLLLLHAEIVM